MSHLADFAAGTEAITKLATASIDANGGTIKLDGNYPTGTNNVALGDNTLGGGSLSGGNNTAIGGNVLIANSSGQNNTGIGYASLYINTTGNYNIAVGTGALFTNNGGNNTAVGYQALEDNTTANNNTAVGYQALNANTTANNNTAVGYQAGYSNTTGIEGVYVGQGAGYNVTTNGFNTFIGRNAGYNTTGGYNSFVGYGAGNAITSGTKNTILGRYDGNFGGLDIRTSSNNIVLSDGDGNPRVQVNSSGYFKVPAMPVGGTANLHWSSAGGGQFFVTSSSSRFKNSIVDYDKGLAEVLQMQPKYFVYNDEPNQKQRAGFIAEDFDALGMTEFVEYWKDENDADVASEIGYSNMVAILVKSIQELSAKNDALEARIAALESN
jgi:hypothetical protein